MTSNIEITYISFPWPYPWGFSSSFFFNRKVFDYEIYSTSNFWDVFIYCVANLFSGVFMNKSELLVNSCLRDGITRHGRIIRRNNSSLKINAWTFRTSWIVWAREKVVEHLFFLVKWGISGIWRVIYLLKKLFCTYLSVNKNKKYFLSTL